jgi:hypothetical protein
VRPHGGDDRSTEGIDTWTNPKCITECDVHDHFRLLSRGTRALVGLVSIAWFTFIDTGVIPHVGRDRNNRRNTGENGRNPPRLVSGLNRRAEFLNLALELGDVGDRTTEAFAIPTCILFVMSGRSLSSIPLLDRDREFPMQPRVFVAGLTKLFPIPIRCIHEVAIARRQVVTFALVLDDHPDRIIEGTSGHKALGVLNPILGVGSRH